MAPAVSNPYQRLPGTGYRQLVPYWAMVLLFFVIGIFVLALRGKRVQLWLGDDHLLVVDWDGAREYYKRIRYQDIQSIIIRRTNEGRIVNALLGGIVFLAALFGLVVGDTVGTTILLVLAALFGLILLANWFSGPTCKCQLRTAVQTDELPSLTRLRQARKALERLRPRITTAQGTLTAEELSARMNEAGFGDAQPAAGSGPLATESAAMSPPPIPYRRKIHAVFLFILILDLPCTLAIEFFDGSASTSVGLLFIAVQVAVAVMALVQQQHTNLPTFLKRIPVVVLVSVGASILISVGYGVYLNSQGLDPTAAEHDAVGTTLTFVTTALNAILGVLGTMQLRRFRATLAPSAPPPIINAPVN